MLRAQYAKNKEKHALPLIDGIVKANAFYLTKSVKTLNVLSAHVSSLIVWIIIITDWSD